VEITLLNTALFAPFLCFCRVGAMLSLLPGFGEQSIPMRVRLLFALIFSLMLSPSVAQYLPQIPVTVAGLAGLIISETLIGAAFGSIARMLMSALSIAGQIMGLQTGLAVAQTFDPGQGQAGALFAIFLNLCAVVLLFATGLHHQMLIAMAGTYQLIVPSGGLPLGDFAELAIAISGEAFLIALQMAAPLILFGLVFNAGMGVMAKMMPAMQVIMVAMPASILAGLALFAITAGAALMLWIERFDQFTMNWQ
jgi:flagellar biosynthesis protein FliR